jgi:hypothetical protein
MGVFGIIAPTKSQSAAILNYALGFLRTSEILRDELVSVEDDKIVLRNGHVIETLAASFKTLRSKTLLGACLDEAGFLSDIESGRPDLEAQRALLPSLAGTDGQLLILSSPFKRTGLLFQMHRDFFGKASDDVLVIAGGTRDFNPTIAESVVEAASQSDPVGAISEWLGGWRDDAEAYLAAEVLEEAIDTGVTQRVYDEEHNYVGFCDLSFGRAESSACSICHAEGEVIVQDALLEVCAPAASTTEMVEQIASLLQSYGLAEVWGDGAGGDWARNEFRRHNITFEVTPRKTASKTQLYLQTAPLFAAKRVWLLDCPRLIAQFRALRKTLTSTGRTVIDHPHHHGRHQKMDDCSNATAGSIWRAMQQREEGVCAIMARTPTLVADLIAKIKAQSTGERAMAQRAWAQARRFR